MRDGSEECAAAVFHGRGVPGGAMGLEPSYARYHGRSGDRVLGLSVILSLVSRRNLGCLLRQSPCRPS